MDNTVQIPIYIYVKKQYNYLSGMVSHLHYFYDTFKLRNDRNNFDYTICGHDINYNRLFVPFRYLKGLQSVYIVCSV